jgi:hypothetical protein
MQPAKEDTVCDINGSIIQPTSHVALTSTLCDVHYCATTVDDYGGVYLLFVPSLSIAHYVFM